MRQLRLGIRARIYSGFASLLGLGLVLTSISVWGFMSINREVGKMDGLSANSTRTLQVSRDFEIIRRTMQRNPVASDNPTSEEATGHAMELLRAAAKATVSDDRRRIYLGLQTELGQFADNRAALTSVRADFLAARAKLFADGDALAAAAEELFVKTRSGGDASITARAAEVEADVLLVRVANWRFLATDNVDGPVTFANNVARAHAAIANLEMASLLTELPVLIEAVKVVLDRYAATFERAASAQLKINDLRDLQIGPQLAMMQGAIKSAEDSLRTEFAAARDTVDAMIATVIRTGEIGGALALVLGGLFAYWVGRGIVAPVAAMTRAMKQLAAGDTATEIPSRDATDEIGAMANAVEVFKRNAVDRIRLEGEQKKGEARAAVARKADMLAVADEFESAVGAIVATVSSASTALELAATDMRMTAAGTQQLSATVAASAEETSATVQSVAFASQELARSVDEIAHQVVQSSEIALEAVRQAEETNRRIAEQSAAATRISEVVELIAAVAEQTNLLALNAAIEAARAGSAGKGFAVVAQEVKALAAQTANATEEIGKQISSMQTATEESVAAIRGIGTTIGRISQITIALAAGIEEQGAATREIARNVHLTAEGTAQVSANIIQVNEGAGQTGVASCQVLASAQSLAGESRALQAKVDKFLAAVRAA